MVLKSNDINRHNVKYVSGYVTYRQKLVFVKLLIVLSAIVGEEASGCEFT